MYKTLKHALDLGAEGVIVRCRDCLWARRFNTTEAQRNWLDTLTFPEIAKRSRCHKCGRLAWQASPAWKYMSRGGGEPQPMVPKAWGRLPD